MGDGLEEEPRRTGPSTPSLVTMRVAALMVVRDEADIVALNVRFHRGVGITDFFIVDNGSRDSTAQVLSELAEELPGLRWTRDEGPFQQGVITTGLAREAHAAGVDWVLPIDADEFWYPRGGSFPAVLSACDHAALQVDLVNFVQDRRVLAVHEDNLLTMTRRAAKPKVSATDARTAVETGQAAFVEISYPPKWVARAAADLSINFGNHGVEGIDGTRATTVSISCFHAPLRAREVLHAKAEQGRRLRDLGVGPDTGWQGQRWADMDADDSLYDDWVANSWRFIGDTAVIDSPTGAAPLTLDTRLSDLVRGYIQHSRPRRRRLRDLIRS